MYLHNHARLYKKTGNNPTKNVITANKIRQFVIGDRDETPQRVGISILKESHKPTLNIPNPIELRDESIYIDALGQLQTGPKYANEYHHLITAILIKLFMPPLEDPAIEVEINEGLKRVDIAMTNHAQTGSFIILSPTIFMFRLFLQSVKTIKQKQEIKKQISSGRFSPKRGKFGILVYRESKKENEENLLKRCQKLVVDKDEYIIPLNDEDIIYMLNCKLEEEDIDKYMDEKMQKLMLS